MIDDKKTTKEPAVFPSGLQRRFLGWSRPLLDEVLDRLWSLGRFPENGQMADFSAIALLLPTRDAARQCRERLAIRAAKEGRVVFPPALVTPGVLLSTRAGRLPPPLVERLAWIKALEEMDEADLAVMFPQAPPDDPAWKESMAKEWQTLARNLSGEGHGIQSVASVLDNEAETLLWEALARVEASVFDRLKQGGWDVPFEARRRSADEPRLPDGVAFVLAAGVPDLPAIVEETLRALAKELPVEILIHAPAEMAFAFSELGRPLPAYWSTKGQCLVDLPNDSIFLDENPAASASRAFGLWGQHAIKEKAPPVLCTLTTEFTRELSLRFSQENLPLFHPDGKSLRGHQFPETLSAWADFIEAPDWRRAHRLWLLPAVAKAIAGSDGPSQNNILYESDCWQGDHLSLSFDVASELCSREAETYPGLMTALAWMNEWRERWQGEDFLTVARAFVEELFGKGLLDESSAEDKLLIRSLETWARLLVEWESADSLRSGSRWENTAIIRYLLPFLEQEMVEESREETVAETRGWLEAHWADGPTVILGGMVEGLVPSRMEPDPWLTPSLRKRLGLPTDSTRVARDLFLLQSMVKSRRNVICLAWESTADGDPQKPSRLLFLCPDAQLVQRVRHLFPETKPATRVRPRRTAGWKLLPLLDRVTMPTTITVHMVRDYLQCPFRFFLHHIKRRSTFAGGARELDGRLFGNVVHEVLKGNGQQELRTTRDVSELENYLLKRVEAFMRETFGRKPPVAVDLQLHWMKARLRYVALREIEQREAGWLTQEVESEFLGTDHLVFEGLPLRARVDRWDRNTDGRLRVIDYKTGKDVGMRAAHIKKSRDSHLMPEWRLANETGVWTSVQLPLYIHLLGQRLGIAELGAIGAGFFYLPEAATSTKVDEGTFSEEELAASCKCVKAVASLIRAGVFWPPANDVKYDDLAPWLPTDGSIMMEGKAFDERARELFPTLPPGGTFESATYEPISS